MLVKFNDVDEFVAELDRDPFSVARKTVRVTSLRYPIMSGAITRLVIVASAKVLSQTHGTDSESYDLVEYQEWCGDLWDHPKDDEVRHQYAVMRDQLTARLEALGFVVAAGRYMNEEAVERDKS